MVQTSQTGKKIFTKKKINMLVDFLFSLMRPQKQQPEHTSRRTVEYKKTNQKTRRYKSTAFMFSQHETADTATRVAFANRTKFKAN